MLLWSLRRKVCGILTGEHVTVPDNCMLMVLQVQACVSHPCRNGALCEEVSITYKCKCAPGFQGNKIFQ